MKKLLLTAFLLAGSIFSWTISVAVPLRGFPSVEVQCFQSEKTPGEKSVEISGIEVWTRKVGDKRAYPISCGNMAGKLKGARYIIEKVKVPDFQKDIVKKCKIDRKQMKPLTITIRQRAGGFTCQVNYGSG